MRATTGNGGGLGPNTPVRLALVVSLIVLVAGIVAINAQGRGLQDSHIATGDIHHSTADLNFGWVPRTEYDQRLSDLDKRLERMESKLDKLLDRR